MRWCEGEGGHRGLSLKGKLGIIGVPDTWQRRDTRVAGWKARVSGRVVTGLQSPPPP